MTRIRCPMCGSAVQVAERQPGDVASCSQCGGKFRLRPRAAAPVASGSRAKRAVDDPDDDRETDDEPTTPPPVRKSKRKKKKKKPTEFNPLHAVLIVGGVLVVLAATGIIFLIQHGTFSKAKLDPEQVLAELQQMQAHVQRDETRPDRPVILIRIGSERYDPRVLNKLVVFPELRQLDLSHTLTTDIWLDHLRNVTSLKVLSLSHTKVTAGGMESLKNMINLEDLNLDQTLVTDGSLEQLKGLSKLKTIHLSDTLASGAGLQAAIPGLQVMR